MHQKKDLPSTTLLVVNGVMQFFPITYLLQINLSYVKLQLVSRSLSPTGVLGQVRAICLVGCWNNILYLDITFYPFLTIHYPPCSH